MVPGPDPNPGIQSSLTNGGSVQVAFSYHSYILRRSRDVRVSASILPEGTAEELDMMLKGKVSQPRSEATVAPRDVVKPIIRTNHPPSKPTVSSLETMVAHHMSKIETIDCDMFRIQLKINTLVKEFQNLADARVHEEKELNFCQHMLSPIRRIPPEVLTRIFGYAIYAEPPAAPPIGVIHNYYTTPARGPSSPLTLSHVCAAWRHAVFGLPNFWNDLKMEVGWWSNPSADDYISSQVTAWFTRASRVRPLTLSLRVRDLPKDPLTSKDLSHSLSMWAPRLSQLTIEFVSSLCDIIDSFLSSPPGTLLCLEELHLHLVPEYTGQGLDHDKLISSTKVFLGSPLLRTVSLSKLPPTMLSDPLLLTLPWSQLTDLKIRGKISVQGFAAVIFQCHQLRYGSFTSINLDATEEDESDPVLPPTPQTFSRLEELYIKLKGCEGDEFTPILEDVLSLLHLPRLHTLEVSGMVYLFPQTFPFFSLCPGISDSAPTLTRLSLCFVSASTEELVELLASCTALEELGLFLFVAPPGELLHSISSFCVLPRLRQFTLAFVARINDEPIDFGRIQEDFIMVVKSAAHPLRTLAFFGTHTLRIRPDLDAAQAISDQLQVSLREKL
ncbi:hypothetical protein H0H81_005222 [Sphagnurus paluster]|uniref:F-box domain-containing protein n=1 Tax=Sphagnurus paluster TaxID=117069 RepID=A0A9P7K545_9AGAR|nr:hypothetical protein H0H81_005222 [Sphagnurus paluster]